MNFFNKSVVVTGAASGIGKKIAIDFASEGANVIIVDLKKSNLNKISKLSNSLDGNLIPFVGDLNSQKVNEEMIEFAINKNGSLDILVNNAGLAGRFEPVGELTNELWKRVLNVNLQAPMFAMRKAVQVMEKQKNGGNIINIASVCGIRSGRSGVAYTVAKHGLVALTKNTAFMYLEKKIRCNAICPGGIKTTLINEYPDDSFFGKKRIFSALGEDSLLGTPEDISSLARFVASDDAKYINGAVLVADGGQLSF